MGLVSYRRSTVELDGGVGGDFVYIMWDFDFSSPS